MTHSQKQSRESGRGTRKSPATPAPKGAGFNLRTTGTILAAAAALLVVYVSAKRYFEGPAPAPPEPAKAQPGAANPTGGTPLASTGPTNQDTAAEGIAASRKKDSLAAQLNLTANNLLKGGNPTGAVQTYKQAIALTPEDEDLHLNLGIAYVRSGDLTNAEHEYEEALRLLPDYPEVHNNLGNVLMRQGRLAEAERHFTEALKQMPDYAQAHNNLGILRRQQKQPEEALPCFQKAAQYDTNYWEPHFNMASVYLGMKQRDKAVAELQETLRLNPTFEIARRLLAKTLDGQTNNNPVPQPPKSP
jgi:Tfp pilus assembly protein PilF